jgi:gamma-glutamyltranspeptidase
MVADYHPLATHVGLETLKKGGSAVDAALAASRILTFKIRKNKNPG